MSAHRRTSIVLALAAALAAAGAGSARAQDERAEATGAEATGRAEGERDEDSAGAASDDEREEATSDAEAAEASPPPPVIVDDGELPPEDTTAPTPAPATTTSDADVAGWGPIRSRQDLVVGWAPRYRLVTGRDPLGLEQELWRRIDVLPIYHRVSVDASYRFDARTRIALHGAAWGSLNLLEDAGGGLAAGDVAIGYVELSVDPVALWVGRRFLPYGPPGGVHVDGGGAAVRTAFGLFADAFVGRPVTPTRSSLLAQSASFEGPAAAYGARVGWSEAGVASVAASYAELWAEGIAASRTVDLTVSGSPGPLQIDGALKLDVLNVGVVQASLAASAQIVRELSIDGTYLHVEPGRWIPAYSILSAFETSTFDEAAVGATVRAWQNLAVRVELAGRAYSGTRAGEPSFGYRADVTLRLAPRRPHDPSMRVLVSRRDDGTIGYSMLQAAGSFDLLAELLALTLDGVLAIDDAGQRFSTMGRASLDVSARRDLDLGATVAVARTPTADSELRAMLRLRWTPEARP